MVKTTTNLPVNIPMTDLMALCAEHQVEQLALFGSVLSQNFNQQSDVDMLVSFLPEAKAGLIRFISLQQALSNLLQREVDLVSRRGLKPLIEPHILQESQIIYYAT